MQIQDRLRLMEWLRGRGPRQGPGRPPVGRANGVPATPPQPFPDSPAPRLDGICSATRHRSRSAFMSPATTETEAKPMPKSRPIVWLRQMLLIRRFEEQSYKLYQMGGKIGGFCHLYSGQEPVAVGSIGVLREERHHHHYRDHGHALADGRQRGDGGISGRYTGCSKGRAARCTSSTPPKSPRRPCRSSATHPGRRGPWRSPAMERVRVAICCFGDGAMNQGRSTRPSNMASLWKLRCSMSSKTTLAMSMGAQLERHSAASSTVRCGTALQIPGCSIRDANDIELVAEPPRVRFACGNSRAGGDEELSR